MRVAVSVCPGFKVTPEVGPVLRALHSWCVMDTSGPLDPNRGLLLWGSIGSGKTTLLEIMRRFGSLVRPPHEGWPYSFRTTNASHVCADFQSGGYDGIEHYVTARRQAFDELGSETVPTVSFGGRENVMQYIMQRRYDLRHRPGDFTHATTNLTPKQLLKLYGPRIFDRFKQLFNFVEIRGTSLRSASHIHI